MGWAGFKQVFKEKYYNSVVLAAKTDEFMRLVQGNLSVTDYAQKFDRLAKFAQDLVPTDRVRADRFVRGLKPMIARDMEIVSRGAFTCAQVIEMALAAERSEERIWKENASKRDAKKGGATASNDHKKRGHEQSGQSGQDKRPKPSNENRSNGSRNNTEYPKCTKCHFGECRAKACYKCGKEGHIKHNCPLWNQAGNKEEPKKDDKCSSQSASHSFISSSLVNHVNVPIELFNVGFGTMLPSGEIVISKNWVKVVPLWIDGRELHVDLIVLDLSDFDVILEIDFLSKYGASINCKCKKVVFAPEGGDLFEFEGISKKPRTSIISAMKAREMLQHGCLGYLMNMVNETEETERRPEETRVVAEFLDVFPEELPGSPYRMAPAELKELKTQLEELLKLGFIRLSYSPCYYIDDERKMCARTIYCTNIDKKVAQADVKLFFESVCGERY
ncbi:uncharacterized protein LOC133784599 [Humulus lupulus]|uniref:uncharacterized protein LOC133784599 n=1 Tax=Humulus lupulus TaxID=3486 RepID=UPI002B414985|nr:uncharacterized protein LOC133784599 [Humulus lupulus]